MAGKPKKKKKSNKLLKKKSAKKQAHKDPRVEEVYEKEITFNCPIRGKITQKVKVKRYKPADENQYQKHILESKDPLDSIDSKDDGLSMFNEEGEE